MMLQPPDEIEKFNEELNELCERHGVILRAVAYLPRHMFGFIGVNPVEERVPIEGVIVPIKKRSKPHEKS